MYSPLPPRRLLSACAKAGTVCFGAQWQQMGPYWFPCFSYCYCFGSAILRPAPSGGVVGA